MVKTNPPLSKAASQVSGSIITSNLCTSSSVKTPTRSRRSVSLMSGLQGRWDGRGSLRELGYHLGGGLVTHKNRFSLVQPMGSRLWTWLISTASFRASITNCLTTSRGNFGEYNWSMLGIGSLETLGRLDVAITGGLDGCSFSCCVDAGAGAGAGADGVFEMQEREIRNRMWE